MAKAFQKIYTKITQITKATCSVKATNVGYDELATVQGRLAQVVKIIDDEVTLQILKEPKVSPPMLRWFSSAKPHRWKLATNLQDVFQRLWRPDWRRTCSRRRKERQIGGPSVNPVRRKQPSELIATGICRYRPEQRWYQDKKSLSLLTPTNPSIRLWRRLRYAKADKIILGGMGMTTTTTSIIKTCLVMLVRSTVSLSLWTPPKTLPWSDCSFPIWR